MKSPSKDDVNGKTDSESVSMSISSSADMSCEETQTSPAADMSCEEMSSQTSYMSSQTIYPSSQDPPSLEIIKQALDHLKEKYTTLKVPFNEEGINWQECYEEILKKSKSRSLSYEEHLWSWLHLILAAIETESSTATFIDCYKHAISWLPISIFEVDETWVALIKAMYSQVREGHINNGDLCEIFSSAEEKFKYSPSHGRLYWYTVFKCERMIARDSDKMSVDQVERIVDLLKTSFLSPYFATKTNYDNIKGWLTYFVVDDHLKLYMQHAYLQNAESKLIDFATEFKEQNLDENGHHLIFEDWVDEIFNQGSVCHVATVCEEMIAFQPDSICFYWIYLQALSSFEVTNETEDKIFDVINRGYKLGVRSCGGMMQRFLETSLIIASKTLPTDKITELIEITLSSFKLTDDIIKWYSSSRGVLISVHNLICTGHLDRSMLFHYFQRLITPHTLEFFKYGQEHLDLVGGYEVWFYELAKLMMLQTHVSLNHMDWTKTLNQWTEMFMFNKNPILLVGYVEFVKSHGRPSEIIEATNFALGQIADLEGDQQTVCSKRCYIKLLQDHLEILAIRGDKNLQVETSKELQHKVNEFILQFPCGDFNDLTTPSPTINGFSPFEPLPSSWGDNNTQGSGNSQKTSASSIVNRFESLKMDLQSKPSSSQDFNHTSFSRECQVFVSNLKFTATEQDLNTAFKDMGFVPQHTWLKKGDTGKSRGIAVVTFDSKETAELAIKDCNKFKVCDRMTFVKAHDPLFKDKKEVKRPTDIGPTLVYIQNVPEKWRNKNRIMNKVAKYGHVKQIIVEEKEDSTVTVRIEFHMKEDAKNAYAQILERNVFGSKAVCRLSYVPKKDNKTQQVNAKELKTASKSKIAKMELDEFPNSISNKISMAIEEEDVFSDYLIGPHKPRAIETENHEDEGNTNGLQRPRAMETGEHESADNIIGPQRPRAVETGKHEGNDDIIGPQRPRAVDTDKPEVEDNMIDPKRPKAMKNEKPDVKQVKKPGFVPMQATKRDIPRVTKRSHMKTRLGIVQRSTSSASASTASASEAMVSSDSPDSSPDKKVMRIVKTTNPKNPPADKGEEKPRHHASLSNEDFKKMLLKKE